jgi:hypothetical protein
MTIGNAPKPRISCLFGLPSRISRGAEVRVANSSIALLHLSEIPLIGLVYLLHIAATAPDQPMIGIVDTYAGQPGL